MAALQRRPNSAAGGSNVLQQLLRRVFARDFAIVRTPEALADYIAAQTAFVSQKATIDYCRMRAGLNWDQLFFEDEFIRAMELCRWEAYAAVLGDVTETALVRVRHAGCSHPALARALRAPVDSALQRHPVPSYKLSWDEEAAAIETRLARSLIAAPRLVHEIGRISGKRVFESLPIHTDLTRQDREVVTNNIRFNLCQVYSRMEKEIDGPALAAALLASVPEEVLGQEAQ